MAIAKRTPLYLQCLLLAGSISLVACGGGSSSPKDTTPDAITFTASTNATPNAAVSSPAVTISGIDAEASISISGGEYSINGGAFTSSAGKISNGQSLVVRVTASDKTNTAKSATITVGGVSAAFSVTTLADVTPASFTLAPVTNAALGATVTSAAVTLSGFDIAVPVSITGGEYSINGGAFTSAASTISPTQSVAVKLVASANHSTTTTAQLTVGGVSAGFSVTTVPDSTPDAFSFTATTGAAINTAYTSNVMTVKGIDTSVAVSITGGEYSVNGGAFTSAAGTVVVNDTVTVKATAANGTELTHNAVLTIGGVAGTYSITTVPDTTAPLAEFTFPTPHTMSEANSVKVRGTATDEHGITAVKLVVGGSEIDATPKSETNGVKDFSSWTATIDLAANDDNEIKVIATDDRNNTTVLANANKVIVRQADVKSAFPEPVAAGNKFRPESTIMDRYDGRNRLLVLTSADKTIHAIDLTTGSRSVFLKHTTICGNDSSYRAVIDPVSKNLYMYCNNSIKEINLSNGSLINSYPINVPLDTYVPGMVVDQNNGRSRLILIENAIEFANPLVVGARVFAFDLTTKAFSEIATASQTPLIVGVAISPVIDGDRLLVNTGGQREDANIRGIISINLQNGAREYFSNNLTGSGESFSGDFSALLSCTSLDKKNNRVLVLENGTNKLFSVDLTSANRSVFTTIPYQNTPYADINVDQCYFDPLNEHLYISELQRGSVLIVDTTSGEKVILSKTENEI